MMAQFPFFITFLSSVFITFLITLLFKGVKHWKRSKSRNQPPGPRRLPIIGNLHQLMTRGSAQLAHHIFTEMAKEYGPIIHLKLGEVSAILISSPKAAKEVLKTRELSFAQRPQALAFRIGGYGDAGIIFSPYGNYWKQVRKICMLELLSWKRVQSFRSIREEEVGSFIKSVNQSQGIPINLSEKVLLLTNSITSRAAFGSTRKDASEFMSVFKEGNVISAGLDLLDVFPSLKFLGFLSRMKPVCEKLHLKLDKVLDDIINEHKAKMSTHVGRASSGEEEEEEEEDLVDVLLKLQESNGPLEFPMTTTNIKALILDIFAGGTESTATTIVWAMSAMLKNQRVMEKAQAEVRNLLKGQSKIKEEDMEKLSYLKLVTKETLRLYPPTTLSVRQARERCEINGYEIPKRARVIINRWAIGRDPEYWDDAESFQPERFEGSSMGYNGNNFEYIPFGAGRRICPGIAFGIATVELPLAQLLYYFDWKLPGGAKPEDLDMTQAAGTNVRRKTDLCLIATPVFSFDS